METSERAAGEPGARPAGSADLTNERIHACQAMVRSIAWQLSQRLPKRVEVDELIGEGQIGLLRAARDFDDSKGAQFSTYAYWRIRGTMLDWSRKQDWFEPASFSAGMLAAAPPGEIQQSVKRTVDIQSHDPADAQSPDPAREVADDELKQILRKMVGGLSGRSRAVLDATLLQGKTLEEAGAAAGQHKGTIQRAQVKAFEELARALKDAGFSDMPGDELRKHALKGIPPPLSKKRSAKPE